MSGTIIFATLPFYGAECCWVKFDLIWTKLRTNIFLSGRQPIICWSEHVCSFTAKSDGLVRNFNCFSKHDFIFNQEILHRSKVKIDQKYAEKWGEINCNLQANLYQTGPWFFFRIAFRNFGDRFLIRAVIFKFPSKWSFLSKLCCKSA